MNTVLKVFLSMSASGSVLIVALLLGKRLWRDKISRRWQYYIWLVVVARLLLPFGAGKSLLGNVYRMMDGMVAHMGQQETGEPDGGMSSDGTLHGYGYGAGTEGLPGGGESSDAGVRDGESGADVKDLPDDGGAADLAKDAQAGAPEPRETARRLAGLARAAFLSFKPYLWLVWLAAAFGIFVRKLTAYQSFVRFVNAGATPVCDVGMLDDLARIAREAGVKRPVELLVNPLVSSPLLIGCFRPCIVLRTADLSAADYRYTLLHELTHVRRRDLLYKWLVQTALCLHWFNPLVYVMSRELTRACEFSCDEAVLERIGADHAPDYGSTLLKAMAAAGNVQASPGALTLGKNVQLLKERLGAIMRFGKKSGTVRVLTWMLTVCVALGACLIGVYPVNAAQAGVGKQTGETGQTQKTGSAKKEDVRNARAEKYYKAGSLPLFALVFSEMNEKEQKAWLKRIYKDGEVAFFSVCLDELDDDAPVILSLAKQAYQDGEIGFFSVLADHMSEKQLEKWLDRALDDERWSFQSVLYGLLCDDDDWDDEEEKQNKKLAEAQMKEYEQFGITYDGKKSYYYKGTLVHIFLDVRADASFYTLDINPKGKVNVKVMRDSSGKIKSVKKMSKKEAEEILGELGDDGDEPETVSVNRKTIAAGAAVWLGEFTLKAGDVIRYDVSAKTGSTMQIGFVKSGAKSFNVTHYFVQNCRQKGEPLACTAKFTVPSSAKTGTYRLFLRAPDDALGTVKGSITITGKK